MVVKMGNHKITDEDIPLIEQLLEELHPKEVAEKFDVAESTIRHHAKKHNMQTFNSYTKQTIEDIKNKHAVLESTKEDIARGYTTTEACERHNITTIQYQRLNKIGLKELKKQG